MRGLRRTLIFIGFALLFVGGFVAGAAVFEDGPVVEALQSPGEDNTGDKARS